MTLAIFDLDNTLLNGDSDYEWGNFLISKNLVDSAHYKRLNDKFCEQYKRGTLDIFEYSEFSFEPLSKHSMEELNLLREEFVTTIINPFISQEAIDLVSWHKNQCHTVLVITATNSFVTLPIVQRFGIQHLIGTDIKITDGRFTNQVAGVPSFQDGKVTRLKQWLKQNNQNLEGSFFYSDSINDLPLLETVTYPIVVNPDNSLLLIAKQRNWKILPAFV